LIRFQDRGALRSRQHWPGVYISGSSSRSNTVSSRAGVSVVSSASSNVVRSVSFRVVKQRVGPEHLVREPAHCMNMCQKSPIVGVESGLREIDHMHCRIPLSQMKGPPMGYPFSIDMRHVSHYTSP
jgi:hypothetical protein